jgi:hypothetical protein
VADDPLSAALEEIRERSARPLGPSAMALPISSPAIRSLLESAADVPRLLAALDTVLKLADEAGSVLSFPPADCTNACGDGPCNCSGESRPAGWDLDPEAVREVITRELTEEAGDGD